MSRSALWRQETNVKERERQADEIFYNALAEGKQRPPKGLLPLSTRDDTFNLNPMLFHNIKNSPYFQKCCTKLNDWNSLVDEIYYEVKHMQPWTQGAAKTPSTAFCLLLRLFTLRCSEKQMTLMLNHVDSPFIRCIGFLYIRYACEPSCLWKWFQPYLYDDEPVHVSSNMSHRDITVGQYVRDLLTDMEYFGTLLPRLPVSIERDIKVKLLQAEETEQRAVNNYADRRRMEYFQTVGNRIQALYEDEENPITWYDAIIDRVIKVDEESGFELSRPKFVVTFPEYGNTELVTLGDIDMPRDYANFDNERNYHGSNNRLKDPTNRYNNASVDREQDLMMEVRRRDQERSVAKGRAYASRPVSYKSSLSVDERGGEDRRWQDNRYHDRPHHHHNGKRGRDTSSDVVKTDSCDNNVHSSTDRKEGATVVKQKTSEELAAIEAKKRKLLARYG